MKQVVEVRLLQAFLRVCGDPDWAVLDAYAAGVRLGYKQQLPHTPAVFEKKMKWRVEYDDRVQAQKDWSPNYASVKTKMEELEDKIRVDLAERANGGDGLR